MEILNLSDKGPDCNRTKESIHWAHNLNVENWVQYLSTEWNTEMCTVRFGLQDGFVFKCWETLLNPIKFFHNSFIYIRWIIQKQNLTFLAKQGWNLGPPAQFPTAIPFIHTGTCDCEKPWIAFSWFHLNSSN